MRRVYSLNRNGLSLGTLNPVEFSLECTQALQGKKVCSIQLTPVKHRERNYMDVYLIFGNLYLKGIDLKHWNHRQLLLPSHD